MSLPLDRRLNVIRDDYADARLRGRVDAARFVDGRPGRVRSALADLRHHPSGDAPLETQALAGEGLCAFEDNGEGWCLVQLDGDSYVGWMESEAIGPAAPAPEWRVAVPRTLVFSGPDIKSRPLDALTMGALVTSRGAASDHNAEYVLVAPAGAVVRHHLREAEALAADFVSLAERFLGVPYLWGGKSALGIDCSGLVQLCAAMCGFAAPRDTDLQAAWAEPVPVDAARERGDLVFWKGHVGIMLDATRLLHANAHHMMTAVEPLGEAVDRSAARGSHVTAVGRLPLGA